MNIDLLIPSTRELYRKRYSEWQSYRQIHKAATGKDIGMLEYFSRPVSKAWRKVVETVIEMERKPTPKKTEKKIPVGTTKEEAKKVGITKVAKPITKPTPTKPTPTPAKPTPAERKPTITGITAQIMPMITSVTALMFTIYMYKFASRFISRMRI